VKAYVYTLKVAGFGENPEEAWTDACENYRVERCEPVETEELTPAVTQARQEHKTYCEEKALARTVANRQLKHK